jgi:hypothetical protein
MATQTPAAVSSAQHCADEAERYLEWGNAVSSDRRAIRHALLYVGATIEAAARPTTPTPSPSPPCSMTGSPASTPRSTPRGCCGHRGGGARSPACAAAATYRPESTRDDGGQRAVRRSAP